MIAYTAWDSLQALAQQYDADLVIAPGERIGLRMRPNHSVPRASMRGLGERLRAGLALLQVQTLSGRDVSEGPVA
jgi:2-hydroxychromene-2-carboxylate isomerase